MGPHQRGRRFELMRGGCLKLQLQTVFVLEATFFIRSVRATPALFERSHHCRRESV